MTVMQSSCRSDWCANLQGSSECVFTSMISCYGDQLSEANVNRLRRCVLRSLLIPAQINGYLFCTAISPFIASRGLGLKPVHFRAEATDTATFDGRHALVLPRHS